MKTWRWSKRWVGALIAVLAIGALSFPFGTEDVGAHQSVSSNGEIDNPNAPPRAGILAKALWKPQGLSDAGSAGTGVPLTKAAASEGPEISEATLAKLPTIESLLGLERETVCGTDERTQVTNVTAFPWRANCQLVITLQNGSQGIGTGWMVGRGTVITAGHCVHTGGTSGQWIKSVVVIPGRNGSYRPYGSIAGASFRSVTGWTRDASPNYDYGAIILPSHMKIGDRTGYYGYTAYGDSTLTNLLVNTAGYPGDKPTGTQWYTYGNLASFTGLRLFYNFDTFGGQSGSVVYYLHSSGQRYAVGIHAYGGCPNGATRITTGVFNNIKAWKALSQ